MYELTDYKPSVPSVKSVPTKLLVGCLLWTLDSSSEDRCRFVMPSEPLSLVGSRGRARVVRDASGVDYVCPASFLSVE